jgi:hypothetical protein
MSTKVSQKGFLGILVGYIGLLAPAGLISIWPSYKLLSISMLFLIGIAGLLLGLASRHEIEMSERRIRSIYVANTAVVLACLNLLIGIIWVLWTVL